MYFWITFMLMILYISYLLIENIVNKASRKKLKYVIHVNGIRGKSTVTRLIGTMLDKNGIKSLIKVTGTIPVTIFEGQEKQIKRLGNPNIKEQLKIIRLASKKQVDALVIECMAVTPQYQKITEEKMLSANITVITNARLDHEEVMGGNREGIINSFTNTIPTNGYLITTNHLAQYYQDICKKKGTKIITYDKYIKPQTIDLYDENVAIALAVANILNISEEDALKSMENYPKDVGVTHIYKFENHTFVSAFSINDNESLNHTLKIIKDDICAYDNLTILLNNRIDRQYRMKQQIELIKQINPKEVIVAGSNYSYCNKELTLNNIKTTKYNKKMVLKDYEIILGMGNVKGVGLHLISHYNDLKGI